MKPIIFFDGECGLCDRSVRFLLKIDQNNSLIFAPLQGKTAKERLSILCQNAMEKNSIILLEDNPEAKNKIYLRGKAILRIFWLIGGRWKLLGFFSFLPTFLADAIYRLVARHRHSIFKNPSKSLESRFSEKELQERFLP